MGYLHDTGKSPGIEESTGVEGVPDYFVRYQILTRSGGTTNILSPACTPKASYHASMCTTGPLTRMNGGEFNPVAIWLRTNAGGNFARHICARLRKNR